MPARGSEGTQRQRVLLHFAGEHTIASAEAQEVLTKE